MVSSFLTKDFLHKYISNMGNNLTPYIIAIAVKNIYFLTLHFKFIKRDKINENELLNANEISVDPFDYHVTKCGIDSFQDIHIHKIHSNYPDDIE